MARDDERRKDFWNDEEDEDQPKKGDSKTGAGADKTGSGSSALSDSGEIDQKIHDAKVLMEQTHQLYQHYFNGIESRPPIEKVRLLESKMKELERLGATTTAAKFRASQFTQQYNTFKDLWERKLRAMEKK